MKLEIFGKNFALIHQRELADTNPVPRPGDLVTTMEDVGYTQGMTTFLVHEVEFVLAGDTLSPVVRCHVSDPTHRLLILRAAGWLPPGDVE